MISVVGRARWRIQRLSGKARKYGRKARKHARRRWRQISRGLMRRAWRPVLARNRHSYAYALTGVTTREEIPELLNRRGLLDAGVEVGVKVGKYSKFILDHWRGRLLISVDPWLQAPAEEYRDRSNVPQDQHERNYELTVERLGRFSDRSQIWRTTSLEAAARIDDGALDFVYIDARHDRDSVLEDLGAWLPKVRAGGIIAGHDYVDGYLRNTLFEVRSAVDAFFGARGLAVYATRGRPAVIELFPSWIVEIPR
jgi:hypothetical protein